MRAAPTPSRRAAWASTLASALALPLALLVVLAAIPRPAAACLWDYDTLRDEQRGLPSVAAVLAGRWERHSDLFYDRRADAMRARLAANPADLDAADNLAVALEKLGRTGEAVDVMRRKLALDPDGYTTHANLGTFHLHSGDFDAGIDHIRRALEINPDAHFGRERYQLMLAEFLREHPDDPPGEYPLADFLGLEFFLGEGDDAEADLPGYESGNASRFVEASGPAAVEAIVGMTRFGTGRSPDLYYALGNLLVLRGDKQLAYRAYQWAVDHGHPQAEQIKRLQRSLREFVYDYEGKSIDVIAADIESERIDAAEWVAAYRRYEDDLIRAGRDVRDEASYAAFYAEHGRASDPPPVTLAERLTPSPLIRQGAPILLFLGVILGGIGLALYLLLRLTRPLRRSRAGTGGG